MHDVEAFGPVSTSCPIAISKTRSRSPSRHGGLALSLFTHDTDTARDFVLGPEPITAGWDHRSGQCEGVDRPRPPPRPFQAAPAGRRRRGDGRGARRKIICSAPRSMAAGVLARSSASGFPVRTNRRAIPPVSQTHRRTGNRHDAEDREPHRDPRRIEHFALSPATPSTPNNDDEAAKASPIFGRPVAHGYLILSFAAGLSSIPIPARYSPIRASRHCGS